MKQTEKIKEEQRRVAALYGRVNQLEQRILYLTKEFDAFKRFRVDRHISWNCSRGTCNACKGRSCRHECHNVKLEEC